MFNYIAYRVLNFFKKREYISDSILNTILFLGILQMSLLVPVFALINIFFHIDLKEIFRESDNMKYYIALLLAIILLVFNNFYYKNKLKGEGYDKFKRKYHKDQYIIPIGVILLSPFFFTFVVPILYGAINGTLRIG